MNNSYFLYSNEEDIRVVRFHICTWEFNNDNSLIEFGLELDYDSIKTKNSLKLDLIIPWLSEKNKIKDYYEKLIDSKNSRFIFNDSIESTESLDGGNNRKGVIHYFKKRDELCILPANLKNKFKEFKIEINIDLPINQISCNPYIRFAVELKNYSLSTMSKGIGRSTKIYDIKVNENRNIPNSLVPVISKAFPCQIDSCFCFHIIPNNFNLTFLETEYLKSVRKLEYEPFKNYFNDSRLKKDNLIVVFLKKKENESFSFFSIFTKERIGTNQVALAIFLNIICAFLFSFPDIREKIFSKKEGKIDFSNIPMEYFIGFFIVISMVFYFFYPKIYKHFKNLFRKR